MLPLTEKLANLSRTTGFAQTGESWRVQIAPDVFTGERINVGIGIRLPSGAVRIKVMTEPRRLACFYGEMGAENILFAAALYRDAREAGLPSPVDNIMEDDPQPIFNVDPEEALLALFRDQVSAARTDETPAHTEEAVIRRDKLAAQVYQFIRQARPDEADHIIPQSPMAIVHTERGSRPARVPIQAANAFAGLESAASKTSYTIQFNLMNALLDVEAACRWRKIARMGMFILRPKTHDAKWNLLVDNAIDKVLWRAPSQCHIDDAFDIAELSTKVMAFALPTPRAA